MSKIAVVYWSGTGNTEAMANAVAAGAQGSWRFVELLPASEFGTDRMDSFDAVAFGCPSMGVEQLEEDVFWRPCLLAVTQTGREAELHCRS